MRKPANQAKKHASGKNTLAAAQLQAVAGLFGVLSEPSRLQILQSLESGPSSVGDLAGRTGLKQANLSKQLGILLVADIIQRRQDGNRAIYSIKMPLVFDLCTLVCGGVARAAAERAAALDGAS